MKTEIESRLHEPTRDLFLQAQKAIFLLMVYGSFDYFLTSELEFRQKSTCYGRSVGLVVRRDTYVIDR
jgi:hypothetical protein